MRIGLVVPGFSADPTDWCIPALRHLALGLAEAGDEVRVISIRYPYRSDRYAIGPLEVIAVGGAQRRGVSVLDVWRTSLGVISAEHRRRRFDVLHAFWATESGLLAAMAGRVLRRPTLVSLAGGELVGLPDIGYGDQLARAQRLKVRASLRLATAVSAGSRHQLELARRQLRPGRRLERLPLGVDTRLFTPAGLPPNAPRLVHVGALTPIKDQTTLLQAFAELRRHEPAAQLEIVGSGPLRPQLERLAADLCLGGAVVFRGEVAHHHLPSCYADASAFVLSSRHEAQGMVALEAAACGRPVVGTHVGVLPELAPRAGCTAPVADAAALATAMAEVVEASSQLGVAARSLAEAEYSLERSITRFRTTYRGLSG